MIQIIRVPCWGLSFGEARHYGRKWGVHIGPFLVFIWQLPPPTEGDRANGAF